MDINETIVTSKIENFELIKLDVLNCITSMGRFSYYKSGDQRIHNTDWHLSKDIKRPYWDVIKEQINSHNNKVKKFYNFKKYGYQNYWFQQYVFDDFHGMHTHPYSMFSNVIYIENASQTNFVFNNNEIKIPVTEGTIVTFPSFLMHSYYHKEDNMRTIISFNSNGE